MEKSYFNDNRYFDADYTKKKIKIEFDTSSPIYVDYEQDSMKKIDLLSELESHISNNDEICDIIDSIPVLDTNRKSLLSIEDTNKLYKFASNSMSNINKVELFDLITAYTQILPEDFYKNLSIKFKEELIKELTASGYYKPKGLF